MPSTYTSSLRLTLPATGELSGSWGNTVNTGITELTDASIAGYVSIAMTDANYTLTTANGATDEARRMMINMTGTLTAARNVICPTASKLYVIKNSTTGGFSITLKTSGGAGVSIPNGMSMLLMCDGTDVVDAVTNFSSLTLGSALAATSGGTGQSSYAVGDLLYASTTTALSKLADVATGNALISGGVGVAPSWGKIGLTTHVTGTLPVANGGTGITSFGAGVATWLGTPSSANLAAAVTDETGSGSLVFGTSPTIASPTITGTGTAAFGNLSYTGTLTGGTGIVNLGSGQFYKDASGNVGVGTTSTSTAKLQLGGNVTGATSFSGVSNALIIQSDITVNYNGYSTFPSTQATTFTLNSLRHFVASQGTFGAGSTVTSQIGFLAGNTLIGATNNYGFYSDIASGTGRWNFYSAGTADNYFAGRVGVGTTSLTGYSMRVTTNLTGATSAFQIDATGTVQPDVTSTAVMVRGGLNTAANGGVPYTISNLQGFSASQGTINADSTVTNLYGYIAQSNLIGGTNNYGFYSNIPSGTNRFNFYASGTADNYFAGNVGLGTFPATAKLQLGGSATGATGLAGISNAQTIQSDVTTSYNAYSTFPATQAAAFTLGQLRHFAAGQGTFGAGSTVTNQYGFHAFNNLTGATNNYGFYSDIAAGTGRWNFYANGTADNFFGGPTTISVSSASDAVRITQTGAGNALLVEDSANPDSTPFVIDQFGVVVSGNTTQVTATFGPRIQAQVSDATAGFSAIRFSADGGSAQTVFAKSRGALGVNTAVTNGDGIATINFSGADGTGYIRAATIDAAVDGAPGTNNMPGRLVFSTTANGASTPTERMRIDSLGNIGINSAPANYQKLGFNGTYNQTDGNAAEMVSVRGTYVAPSPVSSLSSYISRQAVDATNAVANYAHFAANPNTITGTITNQYGFSATSSLTGATNNYGFYSSIASGTGRWNFYANGTADNYFAGNVGIGTASPATTLHVQSATGQARVQNTTTGTALIGFRNSVTTDVPWIGTGADDLRFTTFSTERMRITSGGNQIITQPAESAQNTSVTLSVANLQARIITSNAVVTLTLPTGTTLDTYTTSMAVDTAFEVTFIATTANAITIGANGNTTVGSLTVSGNTSGTFRFRKTAANTFTVYRIS